MRVRLKGIFKIKKKLANGTIKIYHYAYRGGPQLRGPPGTPDYVASYYEATAAQKPIRADNLGWLIDRFQDSSEFANLAVKTKVDYARLLIEIRRKFGDLPIKVLNDKRIRSDFLEWRDGVAKTAKRKADYLMQVFARVLSWGLERGLLMENHLKNRKRVWSGTRAEFVWSYEEVDRFIAAASKPLGLAMTIALETGQRQGDILRLRWADYDGSYISLRQSKTGKRLRIPVSKRLKAVLEDTKKESFFIVTNLDGKPYTSDGFRASWGKACDRAGIEGRTFHDLRGTTITNLARAGCTELEIASMTGISVARVKSILETHYLKFDTEIAENAMRKYEARIKSANQGANRDK